MSHISVNFDRSAFQQDPNVWFPLDRLREMVADGELGRVEAIIRAEKAAHPDRRTRV